MACFPQLLTGAAVQYPLVKRAIYRTIVNPAMDGSDWRVGDAAAARLEWDLQFEDLSDEEWDRLASFHSEMEGRLGEFTFLDPASNLLAFSEDLRRECWQKDPWLNLIDGVPDPLGRAGATRVVNSGGEPQWIQQLAAAPGWFHYCFSVYARSGSNCAVSLRISSGGQEAEVRLATGSQWRRLSRSGRLQSTEEWVRFGIRMEAGASVDLFGMQAEAQPAPSAYRRTGLRRGIYARARFEDEELLAVTRGPGRHSCRVRISAARVV